MLCVSEPYLSLTVCSGLEQYGNNRLYTFFLTNVFFFPHSSLNELVPEVSVRKSPEAGNLLT